MDIETSLVSLYGSRRAEGDHEPCTIDVAVNEAFLVKALRNDLFYSSTPEGSTHVRDHAAMVSTTSCSARPFSVRRYSTLTGVSGITPSSTSPRSHPSPRAERVRP